MKQYHLTYEGSCAETEITLRTPQGEAMLSIHVWDDPSLPETIAQHHLMELFVDALNHYAARRKRKKLTEGAWQRKLTEACKAFRETIPL
jgi:hypothetical protein